MISLPADVKKKESWNGSSLDIPTQTLVANLESLMNFAEHQRIVCEARGLIATMNYTAEQLQENAARRALVLLKDAYTSNAGGTVYISKGIHQPNSNPHMQLTVDDEPHLFHLAVSAETLVDDKAGGEHFHWKGVSFSARIKTADSGFMKEAKYDYAEWPENANVTLKRALRRRNSISPESLLALNEKFDEEKRRREAESALALKRNRIAATVLEKLGLKPQNPGQLRKLWAGETAVFVTKNGTAMDCTYDGTHFTHKGGKLGV